MDPSNIKTEGMSRPRVSFVGGGCMADAFLGGLINGGFPPSTIAVSELSRERAVYLAKRYPGVRILSGDNSATVTGAASDKQIAPATIGEDNSTAPAQVVVFAVKPPAISEVARELREVIGAVKPLIISIAAGIRTDDISRWLSMADGVKACVPIVRCMPNTPAMVGEGAAGLYATADVNEAQKAEAENIIAVMARVYHWVDDEALMDTVTALSGSGPAYAFLMMELMEEAGKRLGLPPKVAQELTIQTFVGAATMAQRNVGKVSLAELRANVTSPNGTTYAALTHLEKQNFRTAMVDAVIAADDRGKKIAEQYGRS